MKEEMKQLFMEVMETWDDVNSSRFDIRGNLDDPMEELKAFGSEVATKDDTFVYIAPPSWCASPFFLHVTEEEAKELKGYAAKHSLENEIRLKEDLHPNFWKNAGLE
jgi:hypothetical protein